ncbi:MAG TPA: metallophosphoesterase [Terriglobales bacterium]|nr:metallophosphoesterase [Terriglobales bacterium]
MNKGFIRRISVALLLLLSASLSAQQVLLPGKRDSVRFAIIGDSGTGGSAQYLIARHLAEYYQKYPFEFVLMLGDNIYGGKQPKDYQKKFEVPYKPLLDAGVKFYAALGNHDDPNQRFYKQFNMHGERYYTFTPRRGVRFFALDSNYMRPDQLKWVEEQLSKSDSEWKICFFHHPLYSSGKRHGSDEELRKVLEPLFIKHGVSAVFAGHEHLYERLKPQKNIYYFTVGSSGKLRRGNIRTTELTARGFDTGYSFMLVEIAGELMHFQTISGEGLTVDSGTLPRLEPQTATAATGK